VGIYKFFFELLKGEHLPGKLKTLSSNPSTAKKKNIKSKSN
jgi:hypothetical protein